MSNPKIEVYAELLEQARQDTLAAARTVEVRDRLRQLRPGKATPLWLVGHLANTANAVVLQWVFDTSSLVPRQWTMIFAPDFAGGDPPSDDPSKYPSWEEVVALYDRVLGEAVAQVKTLSDAALGDALKGSLPEPLRSLFPSNTAALARVISHDAYHRGQIGLLSKLGPET